MCCIEWLNHVALECATSTNIPFLINTGYCEDTFNTELPPYNKRLAIS